MRQIYSINTQKLGRRQPTSPMPNEGPDKNLFPAKFLRKCWDAHAAQKRGMQYLFLKSYLFQKTHQHRCSSYFPLGRLKKYQLRVFLKNCSKFISNRLITPTKKFIAQNIDVCYFLSRYLGFIVQIYSMGDFGPINWAKKIHEGDGPPS